MPKRKHIIAGNWKMHGNKDSIRQLLENIKSQAQQLSNTVELIVFPPYVYLQQVQASLKDSNIAWGAQNVNAKTSGAFTGEISAPMLKDFDCKYVLIGHSERRILYGESDKDVGEKYTAALEAGLKPIVCVGETLQERNAGITHQIIDHQIRAILTQAGKEGLSQTVIAYEPVWAIGTGLAAKPEDAQQVHAGIRQILAKHDKDIAEQVRILYGGSVKSDNAAALFEMADIDGGLVGGASLNAQEFLDIARSCSN